MRTVLQICIATAAVLAGLLLSSFGASQNEKEAEVLLQAAMNTELVKGDLEAAIQQYKRILASQGGSRSVAAKALVRMGHCYERLGNVEARQAYERVVREYADQSEAAAEARTRLAGLGKPTTTMAARQVWAGPGVDTLGGVSPDGRYLSFVDWETGDLAIRNLVTGENRRLTNKGSWTDSSQFALFSRFSPDGKQIAYDWFNKDSIFELRVGALDGSGHRTLYRNDKLEYVGAAGWSPDGKRVLARFMGRDKTYQLALVSVVDGSASILKTFPWLRDSWYVGLSPDGKYVAYDFPPSEDSLQRDIYVLAVDGSREVRVVEHPADDWALGWTPDGKRILFASDRTGTWDAWLIPVVEGKPQGPPELVNRNIGQIEPLGFTRSGSFYYGVETGMVDVHVASLDMQAGTVIAPPARVAQRFLGTNRQADWSPDGRYLAYISGRGHRSTGFGPKVLCIASLETGKQRELLLNFNQASLFRWSPDGRSVLVKAWDPKQGEGYYLLDVETGQVKTVILGEEDRQAAWSRDGKVLFLVRLPGGFAKKGDTGRILARDLATGAEKERVAFSSRYVGSFRRSTHGAGCGTSSA